MSCMNSTSLEVIDKDIELNKPIYEWKITNNFDFLIENIKLNYDLYLNKLFLLDLDKFNNSKENVKIDIVEKLVYDIYNFHYKKFNELGNAYITFSLKTHNNVNERKKDDDENDDKYDNEEDEYEEINLEIKYDKDKKNSENKFKFPLLHSITYLTDSVYPLFITNVDNNQYKFKEFKNEENLVFCFPKKGNHIVFDPSKYHSYLKIVDNDNPSQHQNFDSINLSLEVTLWERENVAQDIPLYLSINSTNTNNNINIFDCDFDCDCDFDFDFDFDFEDVLFDKVETIIDFYQDHSEDKKKKDYDPILDKKEAFLLNPTFFEELFYSKSIKLLEPFLKKIKETGTKEKDIFIFEREKKSLVDSFKNKPLDIITDMNYILNEKNDIKIYNRFLQRHLFKHIYTSDACNWLIKECELYAKINGGWVNDDYEYMYLDLIKIKSTLGFILNSTETIISKIMKSYCISHVNPNFHILKIIIIKQDDNKMQHDNKKVENIGKLTKDNGFLSFCISLSQSANFEGGGIYFEDGITTHLEQGDALIYSGKIKHMNIPVMKGSKYTLFGFIDLNL